MKNKGLFILFLFSVFVLAIIKLENADAWTHLSIGREIFNLRGLPGSEPFIYPMLGKPFAYASWLFGLLFYSAYHIFNIYGVIALKAVTVTTAFYILTRDSLQPYKNYIIAIGVMTVVVIMTRPRFVERPDIFLMVFLSFSVYSLNAFLYENKKYIYLLPLVHMIWANMHVSINLMFIPFLSFIAGGMLQVFLDGKRAERREQRARIKTIALIFAASFALSLISPYFINQYTAGYDIMTSLAGNQLKNMRDPLASTGIGQGINIIELQRPRWQIIKWPYLMSMAVAASFVLNWAGVYLKKDSGQARMTIRTSRNDKHRGLTNGRISKKYPSLIHLFLVLPFIVLSFTAMRFVPLLGIIAGPVLARNLSEFFERSGSKEKWADRIFRSRSAAAILAVWLVLYSTLALAQVAPFGDNRKQFGFGINYDLVPEGALRYMDKRNITGRMFNQFHWGQYITWRDFPKRSAFVDARFNLPNDLLEKVNIAQFDPAVLDELEKIYGFESVLVGYPLLNPHESVIGHHAGRILDSQPSSFLSNLRWALVYWDDQSLLYLKRGGRYDSVIKEDEYRVIKPADDTYGSIGTKLHDEDYRNSIIRELKRNITETGSSKGYAFLGLVYNETGLYKEAIDAFSKVRDFQPISHLAQAYAGIAYAKIKLGEEHFRKGVKAYIEKRLDIAEQEFRKSIGSNPLNPAPYSNLGYMYYDAGKLDLAYENHKKAVGIDRNFANSHFGLALVYKKWGNIELAKKQWEEYLRIEPTGPYAKKAREDIEALSRQ